MEHWKRILLITVVVLTVLSLLLSACAPVDDAHGNSNKDKNKDKDKDKNNEKDKGNANSANMITICHKTGSAKNPYKEIRVSNDAVKDGHATHEGDLIPAPKGGCPDQ